MSFNETDYVYVKKWLDNTVKFGICFVLNSGRIGVSFNDGSVMVLSEFGVTFNFSLKGLNFEKFSILDYP